MKRCEQITKSHKNINEHTHTLISNRHMITSQQQSTGKDIVVCDIAIFIFDTFLNVNFGVWITALNAKSIVSQPFNVLFGDY